jgi:hypothetical protein
VGTPDDVIVGERYGQVKMWNNACLVFHVGDQVDKPGTRYSVFMREGGYVHVVDGKIAAWEDQRLINAPVYDKYGGEINDDDEALGLFGDSYLFRGRG